MEGFLRDASGSIGGASSEAAAASRLDAVGDAMAASDELADHFYETGMMVHMAGMLFVLDIEAERLHSRRELAGPSRAFLKLGFREAIDHFKSRKVMTEEEFAKLDAIERSRAFSVAKATGESVVTAIKNDIARSISRGGSLRDFKKKFLDQFTEGGERSMQRRARAYLENVYRTNTATSYNAGRMSMQMNPAVTEAYPYWEYIAINDGRTRPAHYALNGKIWLAGDAEAMRVYPPNGYQCRCGMRSRAADEIDHGMISKVVPLDGVFEEGFDGPPILELREAA